MSLTVKSPSRPWVRIHRAAVIITVLGLALAASLAVLTVHLVTDTASGSSVTVVHQVEPVDDGCRLARPGQPC